jgi:recombination protein RecA
MSKSLSPSKQVEAIRRKLKHYNSDWQPKRYLKTGNSELDAVFGHPELGIPYGKLIELSGPESNGKSAIALDLCARAQNDGALAMWGDVENSLDDEWASRRGVDVPKLFSFIPYVGTFGKEKAPRLISAEELLYELEQAITTTAQADPNSFRFVVVDSVTALLTKDEANAGLTDQNMRTKLSLASFLNRLLRRWVGLCQATNTTVLFINQLRINPTQLFGNPEYTTGGKALKFYCHVRVKIKRSTKGGYMMKAGMRKGVKGILANVKNKAGGAELSEVGYKIFFSGKSLYLPAEKIKKG